MPHSPELATALEAAEAAAEVIRAAWGNPLQVRTKPDQTPVTETDVAAERAIRGLLESRFPAYGFHGEETEAQGLDAAAIWLVDPIDGTQSFVRGYPMFSTQIALWRGGRAVLGVSSAPVYGQLAWAERGGGAWLDGKRLAVSPVNALAAASISAGNLKSLAKGPQWLAWGRIVGQANRIRGYGDFLHYHLLAAGCIDAVVESDVNILDIAALSVIVEEAGGRLTDLEGNPPTLGTRSVLASNGPMHAPLLAALAN